MLCAHMMSRPLDGIKSRLRKKKKMMTQLKEEEEEVKLHFLLLLIGNFKRAAFAPNEAKPKEGFEGAENEEDNGVPRRRRLRPLPPRRRPTTPHAHTRRYTGVCTSLGSTVGPVVGDLSVLARAARGVSRYSRWKHPESPL